MQPTKEDKFVHAIAEIESSDNPNTSLGDHGRAAGRWQQHPFFTFQWSPFGPKGINLTGDERVAVHHNPTQDLVEELALRLFYRSAPPQKRDEDIAVAYHLHGYHVYNDGDDPEYRAKFLKALA